MTTASTATVSYTYSAGQTTIYYDPTRGVLNSGTGTAEVWRAALTAPRAYTNAGHYALQVMLYTSASATTYPADQGEVCCDCVWCAANAPTAAADPVIYTVPYQPSFVRLTPEERQAAEEADRAAYEQAENARHERRRAAALADYRAGDVLRSLLSPAQIDEMETWQTITVVGSEGNRFSLAIDHCDGNIRWLDDEDEVRGQFCAHPHRYVDGAPLPMFDVIAGQILALTADERSLVAVANHFSGVMPRYPGLPAPERPPRADQRDAVPW